jgi:hypothetical protein
MRVAPFATVKSEMATIDATTTNPAGQLDRETVFLKQNSARPCETR